MCGAGMSLGAWRSATVQSAGQRLDPYLTRTFSRTIGTSCTSSCSCGRQDVAQQRQARGSPSRVMKVGDRRLQLCQT